MVRLSSVEEYGNQPSDRAPAGFDKLETPDAFQESVLRSYDVSPYARSGWLPFVDVDNKMIVSGASFSPSVLSGMTMQQIAGQLSVPGSEAATSLLGAANQFTAAICSATRGRPSDVCNTPAIVSTSDSLGLGT